RAEDRGGDQLERLFEVDRFVDLVRDEETVGGRHRERRERADGVGVELAGEERLVGCHDPLVGLLPHLEEHLPGGRLFGAPLQRQHESEPEEVGRLREGFRRPTECGGKLLLAACPRLRGHPHAHAFQPAVEGALDDGGDQLVLVLEVPVDRAGGEPGALAHERDARALVAALPGDLRRRIEDALPRLLSVCQLAPFGRHPIHLDCTGDQGTVVITTEQGRDPMTDPTTRKPRNRVDTHHHVVPPDYAAWLRRQGIAAGGLPIPDWSPETALALMDERGVGTAILSVSTPGVHLGDDAEARAMARDVNEYAAAMVGSYPARFGFFATLCLPDVSGSLIELEHALDALGADGVVLLANSRGVYLGDASFDPLFEELNRRKAVVFVHPSFVPGLDPLPGVPTFIADFLLDTTR